MADRKKRWRAALDRVLEPSTENVPRLMGQICDELSDATAGRLRVRFVEVRLKDFRSTFASSDSQRGPVIDAPEAACEHAARIEDAGRLLEPRWYGFEVYTDVYAYRAFEARVGPTYPIVLHLDATIALESRDELSRWTDEGGSPNVVTVMCDAALEAVVDVVIGSRKMAFVLQGLLA